MSDEMKDVLRGLLQKTGGGEGAWDLREGKTAPRREKAGKPEDEFYREQRKPSIKESKGGLREAKSNLDEALFHLEKLISALEELGSNLRG